MRLVFMDEAGFAPGDWTKCINQQPFYVVSAICVRAKSYPKAVHMLRREMDRYVSGLGRRIGMGFEVRAKDVYPGGSWWWRAQDDCLGIIETYLSFPIWADGAAIVVVVDKRAHLATYRQWADPPSTCAFTFTLERLQIHLSRINDRALCTYDLNHHLEQELRETAQELFHSGSTIYIVNQQTGTPEKKTVAIDRITDFGFGCSELSVGLQVADFFARGAYVFEKHFIAKMVRNPTGHLSQPSWWRWLWRALDRVDNQVWGCGYKRFPTSRLVTEAWYVASEELQPVV